MVTRPNHDVREQAECALRDGGRESVSVGAIASYTEALATRARKHYATDAAFIRRYLLDAGIAGDKLAGVTLAEGNTLFRDAKTLMTPCLPDSIARLRMDDPVDQAMARL